MIDIFNVAKVPYNIASEFEDVSLSGYIPYTTCREALMQVCFASLAVVNTANADVVEVKKIEDDVKQKIPLKRIMQGQSFEDGDTITAVELTSHSFYPLAESEKDYLYKAEDSGTGENILVKFSEPQQESTIQISGGEILEKGANYAVINATAYNCQLWGQGYKHVTQIKRKANSKVLASEKENVSQITSATLISPANVDAVLENSFLWLSRVNATNLKIIIGKDVEREIHTVKWGEKPWGTFKWGEVIIEEAITDQQDVNLGEVIEAETEYLGDVSGRVVQQSFNLNGNIIVKETILK